MQVEYAEALALATETRRFEGESEALLADALNKDPNQQRALWLSGPMCSYAMSLLPLSML